MRASGHTIQQLDDSDRRIRHPQPGSIPPRATTSKAKPSLAITGAFCIWGRHFTNWETSVAIPRSRTYNVHMNSLRFEWDARKATANLKKHGISFEEAKSAFYDEQAKLIDDPDHSADEERFILLGLSFSLRLVVVCHCYRGANDVVRIISARKATPHETKSYKQR